ncbi:MAG: 50S ribosomal protein L25/general stress protein Ctc [bacterium]|jgi:large subunit ribosomal protein L25|nr:MAG: 50S ribosomal protein L25 [bacterium]
MVTTATLNATLRHEHGKGPARRLRRQGKIPAVIYGHGETTRSLAVDAQEVARLFSRIQVENTIISLNIEGERGPVRALVREVQRHPYRPEILHVDFYQIHAGERVHLEVPVRLVGTAAGVRAGGILQQTLHDIAVRCLPDQIPEAIEADISALEIGDSLHVSDLRVPEGVEIETEGERVVCTVLAPTVAALETEAEAPAGPGGEVEPELIRKRAAEGSGE